MSGIVGSRHNIRGSGLVGSLGTDGQVFTSAGAGTSAAFEAAAGGGKVGQVLAAIKTDVQTTTATAYADVTDLTLAITPAATSSKILWQLCVEGNSQDNMYAKVTYGDDSELTTTAISDARGSRERAMVGNISATAPVLSLAGVLQGLDSPATTSETTYKVKFRGVTGQTNYLGRALTDTNNTTYGSNSCSLTVMEILA